MPGEQAYGVRAGVTRRAEDCDFLLRAHDSFPRKLIYAHECAATCREAALFRTADACAPAVRWIFGFLLVGLAAPAASAVGQPQHQPHVLHGRARCPLAEIVEPRDQNRLAV